VSVVAECPDCGRDVYRLVRKRASTALTLEPCGHKVAGPTALHKVWTTRRLVHDDDEALLRKAGVTQTLGMVEDTLRSLCKRDKTLRDAVTAVVQMVSERYERALIEQRRELVGAMTAMHDGNLRERIKPGDALVVHDPGFWAEVIRLGGVIEGQPHHWNHLTVFDHVDAAGTYQFIQGQPGGVSWYDGGHYLDDPMTLCNVEQPKTDEQRSGILACMRAMVSAHTPYDWPAIAADCLIAVDPLWHARDQWGPGIPGHVVCSSSYDYAAEHVGLATPARDRFCAPWDFAAQWMAAKWR
jgi:hypothetical protein